MSDIIRLLPDSVANQIAAGEVIQRPASVLKELVENAVDAGADDIRIYVRDAGRTMLQVVDNGRGMTDTDARMAFERHATSKISKADDLFSLHTMGFRGEALPSISAISQVELLTRPHDRSVGTRLLINGSAVESQEPAACDAGTNIMVRNIFYNVPARRKFLKSDNVELSNIMREFERLALVNNHIHLYIDTGSRTLDLRAGSFKQRISDIWKTNLNMQLLPVDVDTALVRIHGFISRPEYARRRNPLQYFIANGRNMRHPYFHKAVTSCFEGLIAGDTQPCYFLKFEVDPSTIDVNIHPTKNEIKFENEQEIWPILQAAIKASMGQFGAVPSIDFTTDALQVQPLAQGETATPPESGVDKDYNPFGKPRGKSSGPSPWQPTRISTDWSRLYGDFMAGGGPSVPFDENELPGEADETEPTKGAATVVEVELEDDLPDQGVLPGMEEEVGTPAATCVQFCRRWIVTPTRTALLAIDQRRAHVKILFERFMAHANSGAAVSQGVMFPETITLDPEHEAVLESVLEPLEKLGFVLEREDNDKWRISAVPGLPSALSGRDIVLKLLDDICDGSLKYGEGGVTPEILLRRLALSTARSAAVKRGQRLTTDEMESLVAELFSLPDPARGPDGHTVFANISEGDLDALFRN